MPAASAAIAPPTSAATTLTPVEIAPWSEKSSLRCSAWLCSAMNGDCTTKNAWLAPPTRAAQAMTASGDADEEQAEDSEGGRTRGRHQHQAAPDPVGDQARRERDQRAGRR